MVTPGPAEPLGSPAGWGRTRPWWFGEQLPDLGCSTVSPHGRGSSSNAGICDEGFAGWGEEEG